MKLAERYQGWVHVSMGDLLRERIAQKGSGADQWEAVNSVVQKGELAPEVRRACVHVLAGDNS